MLRKIIVILSFVLTISAQAKIYDSFMCYTQTDMAVIHGTMGDFSSLSKVTIHYQRLNQNPLELPLNITLFDRQKNVAEAVTIDRETDKTILKVSIFGNTGRIYLDLRDFAGGEDILFDEDGAMCYFGYVQE